MRYTLFILLLLGSFQSVAQLVYRDETEDATTFIKRIMPDSFGLAHPVIERRKWGKDTGCVIAIYGYHDPMDRNKGYSTLYGHAYVPAAHYEYRDLSFGPIERDGGYPEIISVFFANADYDAAKEMFILCKYEIRNYDFEGTAYSTFVYDNPGKTDTLKLMQNFSEKFESLEGTWRDGRMNKAKYKTVKDIRAKLKEMGY